MFSRVSLRALFALFLFTAIFGANAQIVINSPASDVRVRACADLATDLYSDPWDMSNAEDINNFIPGDVSAIGNATFSGGQFSGVTEAAHSATFYLFSPQIRDTTRSGGRYGQDLNITAELAQKYRKLAIRMYTDIAEPNSGIRFIFNRSVDYVPNRTVTQRFATKAGWHVYRFDLPTVPLSGSESSNADNWSVGSITGLAILPASSVGANIAVDYIRLEDPTSCEQFAVQYQATATASANRFNLYLDDNNNPLDGYVAKLISNQAASGQVLSFNSLAEGIDRAVNYRVTGFLHSDFATLEYEDPWDMSQMNDISTSAGFSVLNSDGSNLNGTASTSAPSLYLRIGASGISAVDFTKLSLKIAKSVGSASQIFWNSSTTGLNGMTITDNNADGIYDVNLSGVGAWSGTITELIIRPVTQAGESFALDFVSLSSVGFVTTLDLPSSATSSGRVIQNSPPLINILRPTREGGESFQSWNMNPGDVVLTSNLARENDPAHPAESLTGYLPDVRTIEGQRGDFLKGTNVQGNDDPNLFFTFPNSADSTIIDADSYRNVCVRLLIEHDLNVCLGSIVKPVWLNSNEVYTDTAAAVSIYNRWSGSRWNEYCFDLKQMLLLSPDLQPWGGSIKGFRIDPHEFAKDTCGSNGVPTGNLTQTSFYLDWVRLTKDVTADAGKLSLLFDIVDPDDTATTSVFLASSAVTSGGQLVASGLAPGKTVYVLDTSTIANGEYYLYATSSDGINSTSRLASGRVVVRNGSAVSRAAPVLQLQSPTNGMSVCNSLQLKGYSVLTDKLERVTAVELLRNGSSVGILEPRLFSVQARSDYAPAQFESSNSGFNGSFDISSWPLGINNLEIKAYSPDGVIASSGAIVVNKLGSGCSDPVVDPDPSGAPLQMDAPGTGGAAPSPTAVPSIQHAIKTAKVDKKGIFTLKIQNANDSARGCSLGISVGDNPKKTFKAVKTIVSGGTTYQATIKNSFIGGAKLKTALVRIDKTCSYGSARAQKKISFQPASRPNIKSISKLASHLKKLS